MVGKVSNIGAQRGGGLNGTRSRGEVEASLLPKPKMFSGKISEGYRFIENFKLRTDNMDETTRVASFKALCGSEVISWLTSQDFASWEDLEKSFKSNWCEKLEPEEALLSYINSSRKNWTTLGSTSPGS